MRPFLLLLCALMIACGSGESEPASTADPATEVVHFTCPMHPSVEEASQVPCPICRMDLTPVTRGELEGGAVVIDAIRRQKYGVRTVAAERRPMTRQIQGVGTVHWDETLMYDVTIRAMGWVEKLYLEETGATVKRGQRIAHVYSPDLYDAQREMLAHMGSPRVQSKEQRLTRLGFLGSQIQALREAKHANETTDLLAPISGVVVELNVVKGSHLMEGARLARIAGLEKVWVELAFYESDAASVVEGAAVEITVPGTQTRLPATIDRVERWVDPTTRRFVARAHVDNPDSLLLPNMYVDALLTAELGESLAIPSEAIIVSGTRHIVFVDAGEDRLVPRDIHVGQRAGDWTIVTKGLESGDEVVASGTFLVAAESRLRSAERYWGADHGGH